mmetsp:Transcript_13859/g.28398  ORF Transcript_13859/g.28398 Transcript_13859/m.28398 type:complete len:151 (+) Transcript_13859:444-896(+)
MRHQSASRYRHFPVGHKEMFPNMASSGTSAEFSERRRRWITWTGGAASGLIVGRAATSASFAVRWMVAVCKRPGLPLVGFFPPLLLRLLRGIGVVDCGKFLPSRGAVPSNICRWGERPHSGFEEPDLLENEALCNLHVTHPPCTIAPLLG